MNPTITLTHEEFTAVLSLYGYEHVASDMMALFNLESQAQAERFIRGTEKTLAAKGYLDQSRANGLDDGLEQTIHLLIQSKRKIRWIQGNRVRFIHQVAKRKLLVQEVENGQHQFSFYEMENGISLMLKKWYQSNTRALTKDMEFLTLELTADNFDDLHQMTPDYVRTVLEDKSSHPAFRQFIYDFNENKKELDNVAFLLSNYAKDEMHMDQVIFFLPSAECVWYVDYEKVDNDQIFISSLHTNEFLDMLEKDVLEFMVASTVT